MTTFKTLWDNFPDDEAVKKICFNKENTPFDNYCSILISECFNQSGISLESCHAVRCWSHPGKRHVIRAEQLAKWLSTNPPKSFGAMETVNPGEFQSKLAGRTGVIFFKDYWVRGNESFENRSGDHIDLWNKNKITGSGMFYRSIIELLGLVSDLNKSRSVWFWEVK